MADVDHPKTHVEDQGLEEPRRQPESPKHEGIDPLTESDTMYPAEDTKTDSEKLSKKESNTPPADASSDPANQAPVDDGSAAADVASESSANVAKDGSGEPDSVNADGKLPTDAKVANGVGSDASNTSPSNKPATQAEPGTDGTTTPDAAQSK